MNNYIIVKSPISDEINSSVTYLQNRVNEYLREGYLPQGGIAVAYDSNNGNVCIMQAMIKKD